MNWPKVCVIILNWNGIEDTTECLESLKKITYPNYETIVLDNGSKGNDAQVLKERFGGWAHIIESGKNYGFCGGNNIGMRYALNNSCPDYLLLLNNDTIADSELITELVKVAEADPVIGVAGGSMYYYNEPDRLFPFQGKTEFWHGPVVKMLRLAKDKIKKRKRGDRERCDSVTEKDWVPGACFLIKRRTVQDVGLLDENYFTYMDEIDYCIRVRKAGYKVVYIPKAKFWHKFKRTSEKATGFSCYYAVRNRFRLIRKHTAIWQHWYFMIYFFGFHFWLASAYYLIVRRSSRLLLSFHRGVRDGLFNSKAMARFYSEE